MKINKSLLLSVFEIQNPSRNRACNDEALRVVRSLLPAGCAVKIKGGNMIATKGSADKVRPIYVAHLDQVHDYAPFMRLHIKGDVLSAADGNGEQCGVGGDDKCGIYLALEMLHRLPDVSAVFVRDEEVGCIGSGLVPLSWFDRAAFVLQADRNNRTFDVIRKTNGLRIASDDFFERVLNLPACDGHDEATGSITDVGELARRGLDVSMVNISSGYHDPHQRTETVRLSELATACDVAMQAGQVLGHHQWGHTATSTYVRPSYTLPAMYGGSSYKSRSFDQWAFDDFDELPAPKAPAIAPAWSADREALICELVGWGYDRDLDGLDSMSDDELEQWCDVEETAIGGRVAQ